MSAIYFQLSNDTMRLILVKPTNATRRLDSTGEVFHDGEREHFTSGGPSPLAKTPDGKRYSGSSVESASSPQETSLQHISSSPYQKSNGYSSPQVTGQMTPLETQNLTFSQLSDQDWLLLCGQVSGIGNDSPSTERAESSEDHPNQNDGCGCSCPDSEASALQPPSKHVIAQDCISRGSKKGLLSSSSSHSKAFFQSTCQVLPQQTNQRDLLKPVTNQPQDNFMPQYSHQKGQMELMQQQTCNHFKVRDSVQATQPDLFNIPLNSIECPEVQKFHQHPQPAVGVNWRQLFGKEPLLVQPRPTQDLHCSITGDHTCKSCGDSSIILKCCHLPHNPLTNTQQAKRWSTPAGSKGVQSFSGRQLSSLENQDLTESGRHQQSQVKVIHCPTPPAAEPVS